MHDATPGSAARLSPLGWIAVVAGGLIVGWLVYRSLGEHPVTHAPSGEPPPWWGIGVLPFAGFLACIALLPLLPWTQHWWESNLHRFNVALGFSLCTVAYTAAVRGSQAVPPLLEHAIVNEYIPFITVLFALYVISGGIRLRGDLAATPATNTAFLAAGALIASLAGTTGASMLLIRPLLQTNSERRHVTHTVVFFIFLVSNIGGSLLPIGDPPLFLGYLLGVPFTWTLFALWPAWLLCCAGLLLVYYFWDRAAYRRERLGDLIRDTAERRPLRLDGWGNIALLAGVVLCVAFIDPHKPLPGTQHHPFPFVRELLMLGLVALSLASTPRGLRSANGFSYAAILEVAALFVGIFITMQVPIEYLSARGAALGVDTGWEFFWATGALSSFLDNAPTYVVFFELARTLPGEPGAAVLALPGGGPIAVNLLTAISLGAVFMGAMTYIGNGPNFMVKSIAERSGVAMPSFFGYLFKYSVPILIPAFVAVTLLFLMDFSPFAAAAGS